MSSSKISFFSEEIEFSISERAKRKKWLENVISGEGKACGDLNIVFCNDEFLLKLNETYLERDNLTDVITFDLSDNKEVIDGEIYISYERVVENAGKFNQNIEKEINRVMVHGVLHLTGYNDGSKTEKDLMRAREDKALKIYEEMI